MTKKNKFSKDVEIDFGRLSQDLDLDEGDLQTKQDMMSQAVVNDEDIEEAKEKWRDDPPEEGYENILDTEVVEE